MYIAIKDWVPSGHAVNCAAHAGLIGWLEYQHMPEAQEWLKDSFKKVTCAVSDAEFAMLKTLPDSFVVTESRLNKTNCYVKHCIIWPSRSRKRNSI